MHVRKSVPEREGVTCIPSTNDDLTAEHNSVTPSRSFTSLALNCRIPAIDYYNPLKTFISNLDVAHLLAPVERKSWYSLLGKRYSLQHWTDTLP